MNLVVVARRPEVGERCAATINQLTGRHPSRTLIVLSADPDGPSWIDGRVEAHCVMPREDAPETCAETDLPDGRRRVRAPPCGDHRAAPGARPAGDHLVAGRAAVRDAAERRSARDGRPSGGRRLDLVGRRAGAAHPDGASLRALSAPLDPRLRPRPAVALARGDRVGVRHAGVPAVPDLDAPDRGDLRHPRRALWRRTSSSRCTTSRGSPPVSR